MKKALLIIAVLAPLAAFSQSTAGHGVVTPASETIASPTQRSNTGHAIGEPKDTTIQITMTLDQFKSLLYVIDSNIDSKKESKQVIDFLTHSARMETGEKK